MSWQHALAEAFVGEGVDVAAYVPDARLREVVAQLDERGVVIRCLTREEECVAYACGQALAGGRPLVLMQCSGLGGALNAIASLLVPYALGVPLVVSMRGTLGEENPSQVPMGRATRPILDALGVQAFSVRGEDEAARVAHGVARLAYEGRSPAAAILEPELGGGREHR